MSFKTFASIFAIVSLVLINSNSFGQSNLTATGAVQSENQSGQHVGLERAYSQLRFDRPVAITGAGDHSGRLFVVEQAGIVRWFSQSDENPTAKVFLDISNQISRRGNEEGLIGFAFHPDFKNNGFLFCHYSADQTRTGKRQIASNVISRFKISSDSDIVDPNSEEIILTVEQPYANHNGGTLAFGKDGYLYYSLGDGGFRDDPNGNGQKLSSMLGAINRIDVDSTTSGKAYAIPQDNPFVNEDNAAPELYAIGLRNVWRFSFDRQTGELWAADVGQEKIEEVNIVESGGNYGWNRFEANDDFKTETKLAIDRHDKPIAWYGHQWGGSITGGHVYRGNKYPELNGSYFFGDYMTGNMWRTRKDESRTYQTELVRRTGRSIASFGEDDEGELFLLSFDGGIYRVVPTDQPEDTFKDWPAKLSETGLFASLEKKTPASNLVSYEVNAPFWSDNAKKARYFVLPDGKQLEYSEKGNWRVPIGSTIIKHFKLQVGRKIKFVETRLIKRTKDGWEAATYVWDNQEKEAELMTGGKQFEYWNQSGVQSWHAPSASECASCHVDASGYVLGMTTAQLNRDVDGTNQISNWVKKGLVSLPKEIDLNNADRYCSPFDKDADLETRARVYLDVNCAMCHQPNGTGNAIIDLRYTSSLEGLKSIGVKPGQGDLGITDAMLIAPGAPERSLMVHRMRTKSIGRMPNTGSNVVDQKGTDLITEWIRSLR